MTKSTALEFLEDRGLSVRWQGKFLQRLNDVDNPSREVFMHKDFVVKVDHKPGRNWRTIQTEREIAFWETMVEDQAHFAEILEHGKTPRGKFWIKQKRYYPDEKFTGDWRITLEALRWKYNLKDVWVDSLTGMHNNWMVSEGIVVIYDWGGYSLDTPS